MHAATARIGRRVEGNGRDRPDIAADEPDDRAGRRPVAFALDAVTPLRPIAACSTRPSKSTRARLRSRGAVLTTMVPFLDPGVDAFLRIGLTNSCFAVIARDLKRVFLYDEPAARAFSSDAQTALRPFSCGLFLS